MRDGSVENSQYRCAMEPRQMAAPVQLAVAAGSEMRSRPLAGCMAATSLVGGEMLAGRAAGPCSLIRCRDVRCHMTLLPFGLSPTILLPLVVTDKLLLEVWELAVRC